MPHPHSYRYCVVDVFTQQALQGNPLAVFPEASGIDDGTMQRIARELNLSETVFIVPSSRPDCIAQLRIFTPTREMSFAGHPSIGGSFVAIEEGRVAKGCERFSVQEKVGPVPIRVEYGDRPLIWLTTPPVEFRQTFEPARCAEALGLRESDLMDVPPQWGSAGNATIFIAVKSKEAVDRASLEMDGLRKLKGAGAEPCCVFVFAPTAAGAYSRMFAPEYGIQEDPATGSSTGPLAAYMVRHGLLADSVRSRLVSEQGVKMGRRSLLHVQLHGEQGTDGIEVGGYVTPLVRSAVMQF
jgi:trans-2,3-dihydro-3-hydroxyanthranilate isomerase